MKEQLRGIEQTPLLGGLLQAEAFISSKLPQSYNPHKRVKIAKLVHEVCKSMTDQLDKFIEGIGQIDDEEPDDVPPLELKGGITKTTRGGQSKRGGRAKTKQITEVREEDDDDELDEDENTAEEEMEGEEVEEDEKEEEEDDEDE